MDLTNKKVKEIHMSRYIASFLNGLERSSNWSVNISNAFELWLESLMIDGEHLSKDEIEEIMNYSFCGKAEFEWNLMELMEKLYKDACKGS